MSQVSVIIPCYNQGLYLSDALRSCAEQTYSNLEIIVINDGSTPTETALIEAAIASSELSITYIAQTNAGVSRTRNIGWQAAHGDFIQYLDADDMLLPTKIERSLQQFETSPDLAVVYTDFETRCPDMSAPSENQHPPWQMPQGAILANVLNQVSAFFTVNCSLIKREWLERVNGFNERLRTAEDWYLWVALASHGALFSYIDARLVWYRDNARGISKTSLEMAIGRLQAIEDLRYLPIPADMIDMRRTLAARHHVLALRLWDVGQLAAARDHLQQAIQLDGKGRVGRAALWCMTYLIKPHTAENVMEMLANIAHRSIN